MQKQNFNFDKLKNMFYKAPLEKVGRREIRKVTQECKDYLNSYFFQTKDCNYYFWDARSQMFILHSKESLKDVYFDKLPDELVFYFFKERTIIYTVVTQINKPRIYKNKLNLFEGFRHPDPKPYEEYSDDAKECVNLYLSYMKEVLCSNDQKAFDYIIKWVANMCQGKKNDSCLYLKGIEGIGKSTFSDFIKDYVLGEKIAAVSDSEAIRSVNNSLLCGKILIVFEEMPTFSDKEWAGVSSKLKHAITGNETIYADKWVKRFKAANLNNYIINTNVDAIQHSEGRRYYILDLSTKRKGDHAYFGNLKKKCFNKEVGEAFFSYCLQVDTRGFIPQDMPESKSKLNAIAQRLDVVYQFLKDEFILQRKGFKMTVNELYELYSEYCRSNSKTPLGKIKFCSKLKDVQIEYRSSHGKNLYEQSEAQLAKLAKDCKWVHELDTYGAVEKPKKKTHDLDDEPIINDRIKELEKQLEKCNEERVNNKIALWLATHNVIGDLDDEVEDLADMFD